MSNYLTKAEKAELAKSKKNSYRNYNSIIERISKNLSVTLDWNDMTVDQYAAHFETIGRRIVKQYLTTKFKDRLVELKFTEGKYDRYDGEFTLKSIRNNKIVYTKFIFDIKTRPCFSSSRLKDGDIFFDYQKALKMLEIVKEEQIAFNKFVEDNKITDTEYNVKALALLVFNDDMIATKSLATLVNKRTGEIPMRIESNTFTKNSYGSSIKESYLTHWKLNSSGAILEDLNDFIFDDKDWFNFNDNPECRTIK